jgi:glutamate N-acetyltransferase / amino-acid N-acetyltransferase
MPTMVESKQEIAASDEASVQCPRGFMAGGVACGLKKKGGLDLALIATQGPVPAAGMFTRNQLRAAPIQISARNLSQSKGMARAIFINSGCANAATGNEGMRRAERTVTELASLLGCEARQILVNSTGVIGVQLPDQKIVDALPGLLKQAAPGGLIDAEHAIMTTDTRPKIARTTIQHEGRVARIVGIAKGSGMIHPNMATMIAVLLTDARLDSPQLDQMLRTAVDQSFHRISVDGDTSTNDSVFAMASGEAGFFPQDIVQSAMNAVARELAIMVVRDGEGARKLIHVRVCGTRLQTDALQVAQTVAGSLLVRTAVTGGDPNWGRIVAAIGRSGVEIDFNRLTVRANDVPLYANGGPAPGPESQRAAAFADSTVRIDIDLDLDLSCDEFFTCDLTEGYIDINGRYMT